jgi:acetoin:2,6-dichlorophenolindophenol oxidoreductase subunit alpha
MPPESNSHTVGMAILKAMYVSMLRIRRTEEWVADLVVKGEIRCPCHLCIGQEAVAVGVCAVLRREDYVFGAHRSHGHYLAKGGDLKEMVAELFGKITGCAKGRGGSMHLVAPEVGILGTVPIVAATIPMAVGTALASRLRKDDRISVSFFGDGAVDEGTFHESMNLAAARILPVVFVCENNLYSSHLHLLERRAQDNIVQSAEAHGMPGICIDGNDAVEVYRAASAAVARARRGEGPTLIECRTYRWRGHVGPSDDLHLPVRREDEAEGWRRKDPVLRLMLLLLAQGLPSDEVDAIAAQVEQEVKAAVEFARQSPYPKAEELMDFLFKENQLEGAAQ